MKHKLNATNPTDAIIELEKITNTIIKNIIDEFEPTFLVHSEIANKSDDNGNLLNEIKIRKGTKIGANIGINWKDKDYNQINIEITESTKLGTYLLYGIGFPFMFLGAYMGANDIAPLDFLPGYKLAAGLGGAIAFIPGVIISTILKSFLLKKYKEENKMLENKVKAVITASLEI